MKAYRPRMGANTHAQTHPKNSQNSTNGSKKPFGLDRSLLPNPLEFYAVTEKLALTGTGEWRSCKCPFHDDHNASFAINTKNGAFKCFACDAKGGDVIAYYQLKTGMNFISTVKALGAWRH